MSGGQADRRDFYSGYDQEVMLMSKKKKNQSG
jgi:hypothetical protein